MKKEHGKVTELTGMPSLAQAIPLSLQHVVAMIVGCVTPAIIVSGVAGLAEADQIILIQSALLISAVATFIQLFPVRKYIGSGLPVIMGASFAYVPLLISLGSRFDLATVFSAQLVGGFVAILVGVFYKKLTHIFTPIVTGTVVLTIGLSLYPTAVTYMAGGSGAVDFGGAQNWIIAMITLGAVLYFNYFTKGTMQLASILLGMIAGYIVSLCLGMVSFDSVGTASWMQFTMPMYFGMKFELSAILSMSIMYIVTSIEAIGDLTATVTGGLDREPEDAEISGGIIGNGIASIIGSFFGGLPTATFSQNVGIVSMTKVVNRNVLGLAGVFILIAGLSPKFSALLTTIPGSVIGGATVSVFAMIAMTGMRLIAKAGFSPRNLTIAGLSVAMGIGILQVDGSLAFLPDWAMTIFGESSVVIASVFAIVLNLIIPKDDKGTEEEDGLEEITAEEAVKSCGRAACEPMTADVEIIEVEEIPEDEIGSGAEVLA